VAIAAAVISSMVWAASPEVHLHGVVRDDAGEPLAEVRVQAFVDGFSRSSALSDRDGSYALAVPDGAGPDRTVVVWWIPNGSGQVPELALLCESAWARTLGIWGPCVPRLDAGTELVYDVVLHQEAEKFRLLSEAECMKSAPPGP
jgi:hypothetical protein